MKKKIIISSAITIAIIIVGLITSYGVAHYPYSVLQMKDGGTTIEETLLYKQIRYHSLMKDYDTGESFHVVRRYKKPDR